MTNRKKSKKTTRKPYSDEFKREAIKLADNIGATAACAELGIHTSQLYAWRSKFKREESTSDAERKLLAENAKLKRQLQEQKEENLFLKKASAYFARHQK
jgi:transposase